MPEHEGWVPADGRHPLDISLSPNYTEGKVRVERQDPENPELFVRSLLTLEEARNMAESMVFLFDTPERSAGERESAREIADALHDLADQVER